MGIEPLLFGTARLFITNPQPDDVRTRYSIDEEGVPVRIDETTTFSLSESDFDQGFHDEEYTYPSLSAAWAALQEWDGRGDPPDGWIRHKPSNRRRPDGDPGSEYVRP